MARLFVWLIILLFVALVGGFIYFGFSDEPLEQTTVEQPVDRETLGI